MSARRRRPSLPRASGWQGSADAQAEALTQHLGPGAGLDPDLRLRMEAAFGQRLGGVRVHTGAGGRDLAGRFGAAAVTVGDDIAFAAGHYRPGTPVGAALLAHELAHVAQQDAGSARSADVDALSRELMTDGAAERDADRSAALALDSVYGPAVDGTERPAGSARPRRSVAAAVAPAACESKSPQPCEAPCDGPATCSIDSAVRPAAGAGALRLRVSGHTCIQAGVAELYRYEGDDPERCRYSDALQPPIMSAPVALGCFELVTPTTTTMVPGIGRLVLVRVVDALDPSRSAIACARVTAR